MKKRDAQNPSASLEFDEQGINEVNEQIMDAYTSGFVNEQTDTNNANNEGAEGEL